MPMSKKTVTIIDYGVGNLLSITRAFELIGADVSVATTREQVQEADRLILPGVGAFDKAMSVLIEKDLIASIHDVNKRGRPFLGICLGMQLLFTKSFEFGESFGLDFIPGTVNPLVSNSNEGEVIRLPHMNWTQIAYTEHASKELMRYDSSRVPKYVYFAHSFLCKPENSDCVKATAQYGDNVIPAIIQHDNLLGFQFHPEKSGTLGLSLLHYWLSNVA